MAATSQSKFSPSFGSGVAGISIDNNRRIFNFGERVAELAPQQSPFFVYLSKVAKKATDDPVFKVLEQRHQWQRRNFTVVTAIADAGAGAGVTLGANLVVECGYSDTGIATANQPCKFIKGGDTLALETTEGTVIVRIVQDTVVGSSAANGEIYHEAAQTTVHANDLFVVGKDMSATEDILVGAKGQVIGSAWSEGSTAPQGWEDQMFDREGYCQIFKTAMNLFSGTAMATRYRGIADEYKRIWSEKLMEHKMDLEQGFLFGRGVAGHATVGDTGATAETAGNTRFTHGIVPFTESNGKVYNMSYASSGYDAFLDAMEDFFAPESGNSGNKLVLASRKVITYLNKLGAGSFLNNSVGSSQYRLDINSIPGAFGHQVTVVNTIFGSLHFVAEPLLRGPWENYAVCVDMSNVAYRPLVGNGVSRDTFIETNIQANDEDGRRDQIITEAGLEITLPETHAVLKFS
jgi:hypothetical protein